MKFTEFGKALLLGALTAGIIFGVSSCIESYTVGYLYVTTTVTAQPAGEGLVTGYRIDHNTGELAKINGLPVSSGGANPVRAVLTQASRFLYVLNRGTNSSGGADCTTANPCQNASIEQFVVGGNGVLTPQETFYTQGINPFRILADSSGAHLMVLDHDAPNNAACLAALGASGPCGDVTMFQIDPTTGRLSLLENQEVTVAGAPLTYFPVPANPVDFVISGNYLLTLSSATAQTSFPYAGGSRVFPYSYNSSNGQLTLSQSTTQSLGISQGTAIVLQSGVVYVLDNEAPTPNPTGATSQILPFSVGTNNGALDAETGGIVPDDVTLSNPIQLLVESKGQFVYVANQGNNITGPDTNSGIAGYFLTTSPAFQLTFIAGEPFGSGAGPQCIVEDPSNQFIYTANLVDSSITGRALDPNSGVLNNLRVSTSYTLPGPATWCLMDGRVG